MSGVWIFDKRGVARLVSNPTRESFEQAEEPQHKSPHSRRQRQQPGTPTAPGARPRVLVYLPDNQVIRSYAELEQRLTELGWTRYHSRRHQSTGLIQFHRSRRSPHLISLPSRFSDLKLPHMYDIVVKSRSFFEVRRPTSNNSG